MLALLLFREHRSKFFHYDKLEHLKMKDGGITGLAWSNMIGKKKGFKSNHYCLSYDQWGRARR